MIKHRCKHGSTVSTEMWSESSTVEGTQPVSKGINTNGYRTFKMNNLMCFPSLHSSFKISEITDHCPSPGCRCRHWPHLQACECHRWRRWNHHLAAASQEGQHLPHSWWEQSNETATHNTPKHTFNLEWQCGKPEQFCHVHYFVILWSESSSLMKAHLLFVFKEGSAEVLPACDWH